MKRPQSEPVKVDALAGFRPEDPGDKIEGAVVGSVETDFGVHFVLEDEGGRRHRLPNHADLVRKIQAATVQESQPWLLIVYTGIDTVDERSRLYEVQYFKR
jgi:hypothetical protein